VFALFLILLPFINRASQNTTPPKTPPRAAPRR
jgi:hypothetical protein